MLPTTLLHCCSLCLLCQALLQAPPACAWAKATPATTATQQMSFTFASPTHVYFNVANGKQVDVQVHSGALGILTAYVPTLQVLKSDVVTVHAEDGTTTKYFVSSGSVTVNTSSSVQLLEETMALDMLDLLATRSNLEKAHLNLSGASDRAAWAEVQIQIEANEAIVKALES